MHITLALNYDKADSVTLSTLFGRFENVDASSWELRLYSRDIRIGSKQVLIANSSSYYDRTVKT